MSKVAVVIPARMQSTRFPGKPLALLGNSTMIEYVYRGCRESRFSPIIIIATDSEEIFNTCKGFIYGNDKVIMTPETMETGTDRVAWAIRDMDHEYIVNVQGDEPLISGEVLDTLIEATFLCDNQTPVATLASWSTDKTEFLSTNVAKVVVDKSGKALYFSRAGIPASKTERENISFLKHIGLYGFRRNFLLNIDKLEKTSLEKEESLEQLRFMENGFGVRVAIIDAELAGVDTPEDIIKAENLLRKRGKLV